MTDQTDNQHIGTARHDSPTRSDGTPTPLWLTMLATFGLLAFIWLVGLRVFPAWTPSITTAPSEQTTWVRVIDVAGYLTRHPDTSQDDLSAAVRGIVTRLNARGVTVLRPDAVLGAPGEAYISDAVIEHYMPARDRAGETEQ